MRLFFGLPIDDKARKQIREAAASLGKQSPAVRLVRPENYHVTLHFLGEVPDSAVDACRSQMADAAGIVSGAIVLPSLTIGSFPRSTRRPPRVVHFAAPDCPAPLDRLHRRLGQSLETVLNDINNGRGFSIRGGAFIAHVTIAYVKKRAEKNDLRLLPADIAELAATLEPVGPVSLGRLVLYQSTLTPNGSVYGELASVELG